jgi:hypothetical protein
MGFLMSLNEEKVNDLFADFINSGQGEDNIKQIYEAMPYLNNHQQRVLVLYRALAVKYDNKVLHEIVQAIESYAKTNRRLGFRFTRLIESMSLYKHFQGYRASTRMGDEKP